MKFLDALLGFFERWSAIHLECGKFQVGQADVIDKLKSMVADAKEKLKENN